MKSGTELATPISYFLNSVLSKQNVLFVLKSMKFKQMYQPFKQKKMQEIGADNPGADFIDS